MKRVLLFVVLTATSVGAAVAFAQSPQPKPYKVVFDLTSADQADQRAVLRWIKEVTGVNPKTETEVVMYARGLDLVVSGKSTMASEVAEAITAAHATFSVCAIAMKNQQVDWRNSASCNFVSFVPSWFTGVETSWVVVKPGSA